MAAHSSTRRSADYEAALLEHHLLAPAQEAHGERQRTRAGR